MALLARNKTVRKFYNAGKVVLPVIWVCMFVMFYDRSHSLTASGVTMIPVFSNHVTIKEVNQLAVRPSTNEKVYTETENHKSFSLQDSQNVHKEDLSNKKIKNTPKECRLYPDVLIIGFEKCGTMTLRSYLGTHPHIYISKANLTIPYFNSAAYYESLETFTKNMSCTPYGKLRLEKISIRGLAVLSTQNSSEYKTNSNCTRARRPSNVTSCSSNSY